MNDYCVAMYPREYILEVGGLAEDLFDGEFSSIFGGGGFDAEKRFKLSLCESLIKYKK